VPSCRVEVVLGALGTDVAFVLFTVLADRVGAARASVTTFLIPVVALVLGAGLAGETVTSLSLLSIVLTLLGAYLATGTRRRLISPGTWSMTSTRARSRRCCPILGVERHYNRCSGRRSSPCRDGPVVGRAAGVRLVDRSPPRIPRRPGWRGRRQAAGNRGMSVFALGGNAGFAFGPLIHLGTSTSGSPADAVLGPGSTGRGPPLPAPQ
jgi:hypothetical protein